MENAPDLLENSNTVTVDTSDESIDSNCSSDSENVKSVDCNHGNVV